MTSLSYRFIPKNRAFLTQGDSDTMKPGVVLQATRHTRTGETEATGS